MQVAHVGVEPATLARDCLADPRVTVAHHGDVVVRIEVPAIVRVEKPYALPADEVERLVVARVGECRPEHALPAGQELPHRAAGSRLASAEAAGDHVEAQIVEVLEQLDGIPSQVGRPPVPVLVHRRAELGHHDRGARSSGEELAEDRPLDQLQGRRPLIAVQRDPYRPQDVLAGATRDVRLDGAHRVGDQRGESHVTEIDDPGDLAGVADEDVVGAQVTVDDLGAKRRPHRAHDRFVAIERAPHQGSDGGVRDRPQQVAEEQRVLGVPEHHPRGRGMAEPAQRPAQPSGHRAPVADGVVAELGAVDRRPARQPVVHPDVVRSRNSRHDSPV